MKNDAIADAVALAKTILSDSSLEEKYIVCTIAQADNSIFPTPDRETPSAYGYRANGVPMLLQKKGVIEQSVQHYWFAGIDKWNERSKYKAHPEKMNLYAHERGYIKKDQEIRYHIVNDPMYDVFTILTTPQKLQSFVNFFENRIPVFDKDSGNFVFLGETIKISGEKERSCLDYLVNNVNCIVAKEEIHAKQKKTGEKSYEESKRQYGESSTHEPLEKLFQAVKKKVVANPKLKHALIFVQQDGFGLFVNQEIFTDNS